MNVPPFDEEPLRRRVIATVRRHGMFEPGDLVVVGLSGGPDSVALVHLLRALGPEFPLRLLAAHLDHQLRGEESSGDAAFAREIASRLGLPFVLESADIAALAAAEGRSIEDAGRAARRRFLRRAAEAAGARRVALGHHRDDQAESVLLRLITGAGRGGLSGIRPVAEGLFVRPLLDCAREEILGYLAARGLAYRTDSSNADERFPRNRLRRRVLPLLRDAFNPRVAEAIARTADVLRDEDAYLDRRARRALATLRLTDSSLDAPRLAALPRAIARRVVRLALRRAGLRGRDLASARIEEILALCRGAEPRSLSLAEGLTARYEYGRVLLEHSRASVVRPRTARLPAATGATSAAAASAGEGFGDPSPETDPRGSSARDDRLLPDLPGREDPGSEAGSLATAPNGGAADTERLLRDPPGPVALTVPGEASFPGLGLLLRVGRLPVAAVLDVYRTAPASRAYLDATSVGASLIVRPPRPGDRMHPLGAPGRRKLSDLWTDRKLPRAERARCLVVESDGAIAWAVGLGIGDACRITDATREVIVLEALPLASGLAGAPGRILYAPDQIAAAVGRLARDIARWAAGREIILLGILNGSFIFLADLARRLPGPLRVGFLDRQGKEVGRRLPLAGGCVLVIEDILDTGESLAAVLGALRALGPAELRSCVLFDKPSGRTIPIEADFTGLAVPDRWVVGYGLDHDGLHRNLPYLTYV